MIRATARTIAVIPARGGSRGIPNKNLIDVAGRPLISWSIDAVAKARFPLRVLVTTDSATISDVARAAGAEIVERPAALALDTSATEPALLHALNFIDAGDDDVVILLQPTSPIRLEGTLDAALEYFHSSGCDSLVGVVEESPFLWQGPLDDARADYAVQDRPRRQDFTAEQLRYRETGSVYVCRVGGLRKFSNRLHGRIALYVMDSLEGVDIDTPSDLHLARAVVETLNTGVGS